MRLPHTQHTVNPVATGNKHPAFPKNPPAYQTVHSDCFPSRLSLTSGRNEARRGSSSIKTPRGRNSLYKFESVHFMQTWTNLPKNKQATTVSKVTQNYIVYLITQLSQVSTPIPLIYFPNDRSRREGIKTQVSWEAFLTTLTHTTVLFRDGERVLLSTFFFLEGNKYGVCRRRSNYGLLSLPLPGKQGR